jgi:hypothetical protein
MAPGDTTVGVTPKNWRNAMVILRTLCSVIPMLMIWIYFKDFQTWGNKKVRGRVGFGLGLLWSAVFGVFSALTGFLH